MSKIMLVNVTHSEESRVAVLKDGVLEAFEIEALSREHLKGNIYKGIVKRIHPALEAAFVDIGADRDAFLPLDEICFRNLPRPAPPANGGDSRRRRRVRELLRPGEEILVQIVKEAFGSKPPTLTTFYSLPGRYLVLLPGSDEAGISRRIEGDERQRIRKIISDLNPPEGFGIIVRTAAGFDEDVNELARDLALLQRLWENVQRATETQRPPALVYREHDLVLRTIRDYFTPDIDEIYVDNEEVYQRARGFLEGVMPGKEAVLRLYTDGQPIFSAFNIESQIESIFKRRVQLRSGGSIVIDTTEALTAIDVNSGGSVRGPNPEETAFRTNIEACREITRQLRLRDIGGIIVVDFIDMREPEHIQEVERTMRESMRVDKARHEIGRISRLGLLELSRQRIRPAAMATTYASCPMCEGHGAIRTTESAALVALRKVHNRVAQGDVATLRLSLPSEVSLYLLNQKRDDLAQLEQRYTAKIQVQLSEKLMPHQMDMEVKVRPQVESHPERVAPGSVAEAPTQPATNGAVAAQPTAQQSSTAGGEGAKRRRRRGGRRGKSRRAAVALGEALAAIGAHAGFAERPNGESGTAVEVVTVAADAGLGTAHATLSTPPTAAASTVSAEAVMPAAPDQAGNGHAPRRRRRSRGGRRRGRHGGAAVAHGEEHPATPARVEAHRPPHTSTVPAVSAHEAATITAPASSGDVAPAPRRQRSATPRTAQRRTASAKSTDATAASSGAKRNTKAGTASSKRAAMPRAKRTRATSRKDPE